MPAESIAVAFDASGQGGDDRGRKVHSREVPHGRHRDFDQGAHVPLHAREHEHAPALLALGDEVDQRPRAFPHVRGMLDPGGERSRPAVSSVASRGRAAIEGLY